MTEPSDDKPIDGEGTVSTRPPADSTGGATGAEGAPSPSSGESAESKDPLETAKAEAQRFRDQLLRTAADFENFRKRARREAEDAARRGRETVLKELLPVFDNLERAAQSAEVATDAKSVVEGIGMVLRQFTSTLDRIGVKRVVAVGQAFDPALHEAIQNVESNEFSAGLVAAEVQAGYQIGEHLVRAALVVVSKGPGPGGAGAGEAGAPDQGAEAAPVSADESADAPGGETSN